MLLSLCCLVVAVIATPIDQARIQLRPLSNGSESKCATFHGLVGSYGIFHLPPGCEADGRDLATRFAADGEALVAGFAGWEKGRLYWESSSTVETSVRGVDSSARETLAMAGASQIVLNGGYGKVVILATEQGRLFQLQTDAALLEMTTSPLYRFTELVHVSPRPLPSPSSHISSPSFDESTQSTVPEYARQRIVNQLAQLRFSPSISNVLAKLPIEQLKSDVRFLSGEDQSASNASWNTRHSMSTGGMKASHWLLEQFEGMGMKNCSRQFYLPNFSPNIVCYLEGMNTESSTVLISAHYDGRGVSRLFFFFLLRFVEVSAH